MREIEFRGKLKKSGKWSYGNLRITSVDNYIISPDDSVLGSYGIVEKETIGQYSGIKDKNGTKIFEGDILCMTYKNEFTNNEEQKAYYFVKFNDGMFATFYMDFLDAVEDNRLCKALIHLDKLEVVGNIYDNPELI